MITHRRRLRRRPAFPRARLSGSALVAVLWCVVLLSVTVYGMLDSTRVELRIARNHGDREQAYYLALAGVEKAKALIYSENEERKTSGLNFRSRLLNDEAAFREIRLGRGIARVYRQGTEEEGRQRIVYGLSDEESRLNVNVASAEQLGKLPNPDPAVAAAIRDWVDSDDELTPQGAEQTYYAELRPPYEVRNGPLETLREMLMIRGVTPELLLGEDTNGNGLLDPEEQDGNTTSPADNGDLVLDRGWSAYLCLESAVPNVNARGEDRVDLSSASEDQLTAVEGISSDIAKAIVARRENGSLESLADLLEVTRVEENQQQNQNQNQNQSPGQPSVNVPQSPPGDTNSSNDSNQSGGEKLIGRDLLKSIADELTLTREIERAGVVNVNTATASVLYCLPGLSEDVARAIVTHRRQNGRFESIAHLLDVPGMTVDLFKQIEPRVTTRSGTYRIRSEGVVRSTGARRRLHAVVRLGTYDVETLDYREEP